MTTLKILHTADIHLDSAFSGVDSRTAEVRRNELRASFTSMMTYAKMTAVDLMLIAGDLFDGDWVTRDTVRLLQREFETFGKPVFIAPGNHDPASPNSVWKRVTFPANVHVFTEPTVGAVDLTDEVGEDLGVTVYGYAFNAPDMETSPVAGLTVGDRRRINLLCCHCDMTAPKSTDCPVTAAQLDRFGADYAALGHIHNPTAPGHDNRWCYSGCLEPRAFDELGPKGAIIVEIEKNSGKASAVNLKKIRFSKRRYYKSELDLTGCETMRDAEDAVRAHIRGNGWGEDTLLSLRLTGFVSPALVIDTEALEDADTGLYLLRVEDCTRPDVDLTALDKDPGVRGAVYRQLKPSLASDDPRTREVGLCALRYALSAISGDSV